MVETLRSPNVLITGATGFLGKHAVEEFYAHGYEVVANGRNAEALSFLERDGVRTVSASLEELAVARMPTDTVVHGAALSSPWGPWRDFERHNVIGTEQVVQFCAANDVKRLVYVSSPSIYTAKGDRLDIAEEDYDPANKLNNYIRSKIVAEGIVQDAQARGVIPEVVVLRPRGLFGVGDTSLVPRLLRANDKIGIPLFNNGENLVDFTCVENAALALRLAAESAPSETNVYNITNGEPRAFRSVIDDFFAAINKAPVYKPVKRPVMYAAALVLESLYRAAHSSSEPLLTRYIVRTLGYSQTLDITRAKQDLGYEPVLTLDEGIKKYADDYQRQTV